MGDPKYPRKVWRKPKRPLNYELKMEELQTLGTFGLRTKRELWKAHTELSDEHSLGNAKADQLATTALKFENKPSNITKYFK